MNKLCFATGGRRAKFLKLRYPLDMLDMRGKEGRENEDC